MIDFSAREERTYSSKRTRSLIFITLVVGMLFIFSILSGHNLLIVAIILGVLLLVQIYKSGDANRYFIKHIKIHNGNVSIVYRDRDNEICFTGKLDALIIRKENVLLSRSRTIYLAVYNNKQLLMKQFIHGEWTEARFDEIEQYIRKFLTIGKEVG